MSNCSKLPKRPLYYLFFIVCFLLTSMNVEASGGAPLLLVFNASGFLVCYIFTVAIEYATLAMKWRSSRKKLLTCVVIYNILSGIINSLILPIIVALLGIPLAEYFQKYRSLVLALTTWFFEGGGMNHISPWIALIWFWLLFPVTVFVEYRISCWFFSRYGESHDAIPINKHTIANLISNIFVFASIVLIWNELFG